MLTIFEAINESLREVYVGATELPIFQLVAQHHAKPPREISHWKKRQKVGYRSVAFDLPSRQATDFISLYGSARELVGWKILRGAC